MTPDRRSVFFAAKPGAATLAALHAEAESKGVIAQLGWRLFDTLNWHQSLSGLIDPAPQTLAAALRAGAGVRGESFVMTLNRLRSDARGEHFGWSFRGRGEPAGFSALKSGLRDGLLKEGIENSASNTPHISISYNAQTALPTTPITPVDWLVDELLLLAGEGHPYRYTILGRWPLAPLPVPATEQLGLFA